jgi:ubiquinol-cytochrome c reductase cytochrome c subunit
MTSKKGEKLFSANCASCHGMGGSGSQAAPSLVGVGAASVDFQVGSGRMPMQMDGPQAQVKPVQFNDEQVRQMAAYVASLGAGPAIPSEEILDASEGDAANGGELFRVNCAMCHNAAAAGGALTRGKFAPSLEGSSEKHIYEAMVTGPQNMPVFNDANVSPEDKQGHHRLPEDHRRAGLPRRSRPRLARPGLRRPVHLGRRTRASSSPSRCG